MMMQHCQKLKPHKKLIISNKLVLDRYPAYKHVYNVFTLYIIILIIIIIHALH